MNWEKAKNHLYLIMNIYAAISMAEDSRFVTLIMPLEKRFIEGERTAGLYRAIMNLG